MVARSGSGFGVAVVALLVSCTSSSEEPAAMATAGGEAEGLAAGSRSDTCTGSEFASLEVLCEGLGIPVRDCSGSPQGAGAGFDEVRVLAFELNSEDGLVVAARAGTRWWVVDERTNEFDEGAETVDLEIAIDPAGLKIDREVSAGQPEGTAWRRTEIRLVVAVDGVPRRRFTHVTSESADAELDCDPDQSAPCERECEERECDAIEGGEVDDEGYASDEYVAQYDACEQECFETCECETSFEYDSAVRFEGADHVVYEPTNLLGDPGLMPATTEHRDREDVERVALPDCSRDDCEAHCPD